MFIHCECKVTAKIHFFQTLYALSEVNFVIN